MAFPSAITVAWLACMTGEILDCVAMHWQSSLTTVLGGFVAGSTPQGGEAIVERPACRAPTRS